MDVQTMLKGEFMILDVICSNIFVYLVFKETAADLVLQYNDTKLTLLKKYKGFLNSKALLQTHFLVFQPNYGMALLIFKINPGSRERYEATRILCTGFQYDGRYLDFDLRPNGLLVAIDVDKNISLLSIKKNPFKVDC